MTDLPLTSVQPDPEQPRRRFDPDTLAELADSIRSHGLLEPILVRPRPTRKGKPGGWTIIAGERRWRACQMAGLDRIPVIVRDDLDAAAAGVDHVADLRREGEQDQARLDAGGALADPLGDRGDVESGVEQPLIAAGLLHRGHVGADEVLDHLDLERADSDNGSASRVVSVIIDGRKRVIVPAHRIVAREEAAR
jgi:hypothetical protein